MNLPLRRTKLNRLKLTSFFVRLCGGSKEQQETIERQKEHIENLEAGLARLEELLSK